MFRRTNKYRIYPSKQQQVTIDKHLEICRKVYNNILEIKIETYKQSGKNLSRYDLDGCLIYLKSNCPEYSAVYSHILGRKETPQSCCGEELRHIHQVYNEWINI